MDQQLDFDSLLRQLQQANQPEAIFGPLNGAGAAALKQRFHQLALLVHPDHQADQRVAAGEAFKRLQALYALAQRKLAAGSYGTPQLTLIGRRHSYQSVASSQPGDLADLWPADASGTPVLLKIARLPRNNDLLAAEASALELLDARLSGQRVRAHFPTLVETLAMRDAGGAERRVNVLRAEQGAVTLAAVISAYPRGIDAADAAWMFKRLLTILALTHQHELVHGAVLPEHVLIFPESHNALLLDWCYSAPLGGTVKAISPASRAAYPPEVLAKQPAGPATDLYMAARCITRVFGGSTDADSLPPSVPRPIRNLLRAMLLGAAARRPNDAWEVYDDLNTILGALYGPPKFRPFAMP